ncbi:muramoyltetrapeptide carboxypeptidase [Kitasatospora sp. SolWspMP-SS2h]|uniref:S66 peptidase family protein n=1 Tax=Kitasatospora sp. SolWspMP-SS2h TaxID=1305729 RepID=UPI000DB93E64|nr:LD-carboxypeptidase [Kitasatospora sp. SolWspMP-SS2h]RAJ36832.1 muramoyltetrapeptide carboxypeptidase [Kitasatospora sp. SolWspMP-SS2h]
MTAPRTGSVPLLRPPALRQGDTVAVVAPAGPVEPARLAHGVEVLESWGLRVSVMPHVSAAHLGHLAGRDVDRASDLQAAWTDPGIAAVLCARGGYGCQRTADLLDWAALARAVPKPLVGFSDATELHRLFAARLGVATLHGPMVATAAFAEPQSLAHLRRVLFAPGSVRELPLCEGALVAGRAQGVLAGGNASLLASSLGGPGPVVPDGCLLLLEEVGEEPYRLDRILTQLRRAGALGAAAGIVLGDFTDCGPPAAVAEVLHDRLGGLGVPVAAGLPTGHGRVQLTVPLGVRAELTAAGPGASTLVLAEPPLAPPGTTEHDTTDTDRKDPHPCAS